MATISQLPQKYQMGFENGDKQHLEIIELLDKATTIIKMPAIKRKAVLEEIVLDLEKYSKITIFLQKWFLNHIQITDRKFATFIKKQKTVELFHK